MKLIFDFESPDPGFTSNPTEVRELSFLPGVALSE